MFACIFFEEDSSLTVVNQKDKALNVQNGFTPNEKVSMKWGKKVYNGVIIKVGGKYILLSFYICSSTELLIT